MRHSRMPGESAKALIAHAAMPVERHIAIASPLAASIVPYRVGNIARAHRWRRGKVRILTSFGQRRPLRRYQRMSAPRRQARKRVIVRLMEATIIFRGFDMMPVLIH